MSRGVFRVDQRPDMQTADAGVAVVAGAGAVLVDDIAEADEELRQLRRIDGAVFDKRDRLSFAFHSEQQAEPGFAHLPDAGLLGGIKRADIGIAETCSRFSAASIASSLDRSSASFSP